MPRLPAHRRVKRHEVYTIAEAAAAVGMHRQTVARWITRDGLPAARAEKPWLIEGAELKAWLLARRTEGRVRLGPGELFCLPCRAARRPAGGFVEHAPHRAGQGRLTGICPDCDRLMHRVFAAADLAAIAGDLEVAFA